MNLNRIGRSALAVALWVVTAPIAVRAQTLTTLFNFDGANGYGPNGSLIQGTDGNLYGSTALGGTSTVCGTGCGTLYRITFGGTLTTLHSFAETDGSIPYSRLIESTKGIFYGTTYEGGTSTNCAPNPNQGCGTVFQMTAGGAVSAIHSFVSTDGRQPYDGLVQGADGNFYGTTLDGGTNDFGTVFKITPAGVLTTLHNFAGSDGSWPFDGLIQGSDGNFYGTTAGGGSDNSGTVFKMTPSGALTTLHSFALYTDGYSPEASLVEGADGNFYGTTSEGVNFSCFYGCGSVFKMTPAGDLTTLYAFNGTDGDYPEGTLIQATDGNFYGTTIGGGASEWGTLFNITPGGTLTTLHVFGGSDGISPIGALIQATNGTFYGATGDGGANNMGTVFSFSMGFAPFVKAVPSSGAVGGTVGLRGTSLESASAVTFNGVKAAFKIESSTEILAIVPAGATTGLIQVTTPDGKLSSNAAFRVTP